jgi:hypothetical protein
LGLADLAGRQHGVVSIRQLEGALGFSERSASRAVAAGHLHRIHRGVYAVGHTNLSLHGRCMAAVLAVGDEALLSYWSAGWLWGLLPNTSPRPFHVTTFVTRHHPAPKTVVRHRARNLVDADRDLQEGIPVTSVSRSILDLAWKLQPQRLPRVIERAEELKLFDLDALVAVTDRNKGHHGARRLHEALASHRPAPWARSEFERQFVAAALAAGLPQPATGWNEVGLELDVYWPEAAFAVELDSWKTHGTRGAFERDRERDEKLALAGIATVRVTEARFRAHREEVLRMVATLLGRRPWRPG